MCEKPRIKCGECPNQAFIAVTTASLLRTFADTHADAIRPVNSWPACIRSCPMTRAGFSRPISTVRSGATLRSRTSWRAGRDGFRRRSSAPASVKAEVMARIAGTGHRAA